MYLKLKPQYEAAMRETGQVDLTPASKLRLFAPNDPFLAEKFDLDAPQNWHFGITQEYINDGEIRERLQPSLLTFFNSKDDAMNALLNDGVEVGVTITQYLSLRWQEQDAKLEIVAPR